MKYRYCYRRKIWLGREFVKNSSLLELEKKICKFTNFYKNSLSKNYEFQIRKE